jgi:probable HAF family extracellular repeat protein
MKRCLLLVVLLSALFTIHGCGSGGGGDSLPDTGGGGGGGGTGEVGELGPLVDTGDLLGSAGDNWYFTITNAINGAGQIVGQSNAGSPVKAAFMWDPSTEQMTYLGIHNFGAYDDYFGLKTTPSDTFLIYSNATDINNAGVAIGYSTTGSETERRAFAWDATRGFMDLSPPPYVDSSGKRTVKSFSEAADINKSGEVLLTAEDATGKHAYYWDGVSFQAATLDREDQTTVNVIVPALVMVGRILGADSEAVAINENGQVVVNSGGTAVFHDLNVDVIESLNHLPGSSSTTAVDINNQGSGRGHIIGTSGNRGFFWDGGAMYPIDTLGGDTSEAVDINDNDRVVGNAKTAEGKTHAFLWRLGPDKKGIITDLGTLGGDNSFAVAINNAGVVVGYSDTGKTYSEGGITVNIQHAFLWRDGVMYDLGTHNDFYDYPFIPPFPVSEAVGINASGQVAGNSFTINAHPRGFFLSPVFP